MSGQAERLGPEQVDAIVVGARCAGSAASIALARAGRRVVALDGARFPSDTISTHLLWAGGVAELAQLGALKRVEADVRPPRLPEAYAAGEDVVIRATYTPVDDIAYGMCVRRPGLDAALVATAREAGAEVREGTRVTDLIWQDGRVAGVRASDRTGQEYELRAPLVIGADGRRSTVARLVGALEPHLSNPNGRACFYGYYSDPREEWRGVAATWRSGFELGNAFPCDGGLVMVLLMPPVERAEAFHADRVKEFERTVGLTPGLAARLEGCTLVTDIAGATDLSSYFRVSAGAGWALAGDAGHFKDPVTAQGIRDAMRYGRLLGEAVAPVLDDPRQLDQALVGWQRLRDRDCLEAYHWTNRLARAERISPLELEFMRALAARPDTARKFLDIYSRQRRPSQVLTPGLALSCTARALLRPGIKRWDLIRMVGREARAAVAETRERRAALRAPAGSGEAG